MERSIFRGWLAQNSSIYKLSLDVFVVKPEISPSVRFIHMNFPFLPFTKLFSITNFAVLCCAGHNFFLEVIV
jgi:hypothetical protein